MDAFIRLANRDDAAQICDIYAPVVAQTATSFEYEIPSLDDMRERIEKTLMQYPWLVFQWDDSVIGYAYGSSHRSRTAYQWSVEVSVYVHPQYQRRQIGKALYIALLAGLKLQGYVNAYAGIALPNPASVRLHESVGFQAIGVFESIGYKLGAWHDVGWWQCPIQLAPNHPDAPKPVNTICDSEEWAAAMQSGLLVARLQLS